jgi:hypothetical protein
MSDLLIVEEYPDFFSASRRAKELAIQFKECTSIQRAGTGWAVLASGALATVLATPIEKNIYDDDFESYTRDAHDSEDQLVAEEIQSDQDSWARSEEDGWFYED